ncbi:hypothetical protein XA68_11683 [Ophiocordyceps unilateralis]|uniref:Apple domain-containing protein n=1 Tax=Ophiocordyceps unilateralis TaxID=268505 RepID=A0A2A9PFD8_OPHUN|nr:hypothetical protein XA68_11683 [Ophiocordyceps unilateralis]
MKAAVVAVAVVAVAEAARLPRTCPDPEKSACKNFCLSGDAAFNTDKVSCTLVKDGGKDATLCASNDSFNFEVKYPCVLPPTLRACPGEEKGACKDFCLSGDAAFNSDKVTCTLVKDGGRDATLCASNDMFGFEVKYPCRKQDATAAAPKKDVPVGTRPAVGPLKGQDAAPAAVPNHPTKTQSAKQSIATTKAPSSVETKVFEAATMTAKRGPDTSAKTRSPGDHVATKTTSSEDIPPPAPRPKDKVPYKGDEPSNQASSGNGTAATMPVPCGGTAAAADAAANAAADAAKDMNELKYLTCWDPPFATAASEPGSPQLS